MVAFSYGFWFWGFIYDSGGLFSVVVLVSVAGVVLVMIQLYTWPQVNTASDFGSSLRSLWARHAATGVVLTSPRSQPLSNVHRLEMLFYISRVFPDLRVLP